MRLASEGPIGFREKQAFRWLRLRKRAFQYARYRPGAVKPALFVVGCQRSGTSLMHHLLRLDFHTVTYDEESPLSRGDRVEGLRWAPLEEVARRFAADRAALVVAKPLVESQNLDRLLAAFPGSRALWMYRDVGPVARSNVKYFAPGTSHRDLQPILKDDQADWRAERLGRGARELVGRLYRPDLAPEDAAALFWYARNSLLFERGLDGDPRVRACRYEDLLRDPAGVMRAVYGFIERPWPGERIVADVEPAPARAATPPVLEPAVAEACAGLLARLDAVPRVVPAD
ncbi:sulfotransferase [bacterium]|nr:sulfotransferase [bacterium]